MFKWVLLGLMMGTLVSAFGINQPDQALRVQLTFSAIDSDQASEKAKDLSYIQSLLKDELALDTLELKKIESAQCVPQKTNQLLYDCELSLKIVKS